MRDVTQRPRFANRRSAFTLVEILIVVIILGILATVIIGLFANSAADASANALKDNLRAIRSSLQIYLAQHGSYPALSTFESQMTQYSDASGATAGSHDATHIYGPYIMTVPPLPVGTNRGLSTVTSTTYSAGYGWGYDPTTGTFKANLPDGDVDGDGKSFNTY